MKNDSRQRRLPRLFGAGFLLMICVLLAIGCAVLDRGTAEAQEEGGKMARSPNWEEVDRLVAEDKAQAALDIVTALRTKARDADDGSAWTQALIKETQLRVALHGYETAVRTLHEAAWPEAPLPLAPFDRAVIDLFYAQTLHTYLQVYSWEINQREAVDSGGPLDLKAWTRDRIAAEIHQAYAALWVQRQAWGSESLGVLSVYIEQNNYPARIRGTLRDAVTYLWVGLLGDTSLWRPEQSNEVYQLDLARLIAGRPETEADTKAWLADPAVHPMAKLAHLLGDLEIWHGEGERPEAAFEAYRERLQQLADSFTQSADRQTIRDDLEAALERLGRRYPWWSQGQASLAEMVRGDDAPDSLVQAREIARAGAAAHPKSIGGQHCQHIVAAIEAPAYSLTSMASDAAGRRSIAVQHRNLEALHFRAYALDLDATVTRSKDYNLLPARREVEQIMRARRPIVAWQIELPATVDYRMHRTYVTPPLEAPGLYVIVASVRGDFAEAPNQRSAINLIITDLVLVSRTHPGELEVTVRSGASGAPAAGAEVRLFRFDYRKGHQRVASRQTAGDGVVRFSHTEDRRNNYFVLAARGADRALDRVRPHYRGAPGRETESALIYTDRSVYRPGQMLHWKVVAYGGQQEEGRFTVAPDATMKVELLDANHQVVESAEVTTNRFGSASGSFGLPAGRLLGSWSLRTTRGGQSRVEVEAYKRPTFEVSIADPTAPLRLNREAALSGTARYYFGLPVTGGTVAWRVNREPIFPRHWYHWGWIPPGAGTPQTIAAGRATLTADGTFDVAFTPEADEREASSGVSYRYRLEADVTDDGGETRSASRSFRLGFVAVEATLTLPAGFLDAKTHASVTVQRTDLNAIPRAGAGRWRVVRLQQPTAAQLPAAQPEPRPRQEGEARFETPGDRLRPRWAESFALDRLLATWEAGAAVVQGEVNHDEDGKATLKLPALAPGAYRLIYETVDDFGATFETMESFVVAAARTPLAVPAALIAERDSVPVGEKARLFVHAGLADQPFMLEIFRGGNASERRVLTAEEGGIIEIPITASDRGGLTARLTLLRDHQLIRLEERVFVPWDDRQLHIAFETFRDRIRPGREETWRLVVRGADEAALAAGAAEVLAYMYDRSLDLFAPHQPPMPLGLYPTRPGPRPLGTSLGADSAVWQQTVRFGDLPSYPSLTGDRLIFLDGYGFGGPGRRGGVGRFAMQKMRAPSSPSPVARGQAAEMMTVTSESPMLEEASAVASDAAGSPPEPEAPPPPPPADEPSPLRSDFSETAFWFPHLIAGEDGAVRIELTVPDSVTEWNVWAHALTRDLRAGSQLKTTRSVKELLVRPYLPRFLREGDEAALDVVVNNAGEVPLSGHLSFDIRDPESDESLLTLFGLDAAAADEVPFTVEPGGGVDLTFPVRVPARVGPVAFRVVGQAGDWSDGELRPLPVLPGRIHLAQSRFAALHDSDRRELHFADLAADDDPTRIDDQLVVTLDGQLFYSVLAALPYLTRYPYECTEQTLNRFLSTGIAASFYRDYPAVARMAEQLAARDSQLETWDGADPNRKMALEETPWLVSARGGDKASEDLVNVLDPRVAKAERDVALAKLRQAQTSLGGFPWWPGGPPSPHMTLYLLSGFARGLEFGVDVPRDMVVRGWAYVHRHYLDALSRRLVEDECCWELITYLNYVLSSYPDTSWTGEVFSDDDRRTMLDFSFRHWRQHAPLLKGYLALTLQRAGREADARLVFDSVMDSARTTRDEGTFWAPEDRAWLWYNDTIETHAFALRTLSELTPDDPRRKGLVHWLFLNKKLNHWKSTRATAEVIYALAHYLQREGTLGAREAAVVQVGSRQERFVFEPDRYTGKNVQLRIPGSELKPATMSTVVVEKDTPGLLFASATWHFSTERLPSEARGDFFNVERRYFRRLHDGREWVLKPLEEGATLVPGDQLEVQISLRAKHAAEYVHLRDPRGAGFEPESSTSGYRYTLGLGYYEEVRDSGTNFFFDRLPVGEYTFKYRLRANLAGTFKVAPATVQSMYAPEFVGYSAGAVLTIVPSAP